MRRKTSWLIERALGGGRLGQGVRELSRGSSCVGREGAKEALVAARGSPLDQSARPTRHAREADAHVA